MSATSVVPKARVISVRSVVSVHWRSEAALDLEDEHPDDEEQQEVGERRPASLRRGGNGCWSGEGKSGWCSRNKSL